MAGEPSLLRPLSLGEVFDRAVTLYIRNFAPFTFIVLVIVLPLAILQYFAGLHDSATFAQILQQVQKPGKAPSPATPFASMWAFGTIALAAVLTAFAFVAIARAVGALYRGETPQWRACYALALQRTVTIVATLVCEVAIIVFAIVGGAIAMGLTFAVAYLIVRSSAIFAVVVLIAAAIVALLWFVALLLCYLACGFAYSAIGVERLGAAAAIGRGFARIFSRAELWRAVLVCLALLAIYVGIAAVTIGVQAVFESLNLQPVSVLVNAVLSLVTTSFLGILIAVYYFDVRVRREGLDLQASIDALQPSSLVP
jgi:hypothetical protein